MEEMLLFCLGFFCVKECHVSLRYCVCMIKSLHIRTSTDFKKEVRLCETASACWFPNCLNFPKL